MDRERKKEKINIGKHKEDRKKKIYMADIFFEIYP